MDPDFLRMTTSSLGVRWCCFVFCMTSPLEAAANTVSHFSISSLLSAMKNDTRGLGPGCSHLKQLRGKSKELQTNKIKAHALTRMELVYGGLKRLAKKNPILPTVTTPKLIHNQKCCHKSMFIKCNSLLIAICEGKNCFVVSSKLFKF